MSKSIGYEVVAQALSLMDKAIKVQGKKGVIKCPKCGGDAKYWYGGPRAFSIKCETPECVEVSG